VALVARRLCGLFICGSFWQLLHYLWLTEPQVVSEPDNLSDAQRLAAYPIEDSSDLMKSAQDTKLIPSPQLSGHVDVIRRVDERDVVLAG
jgi:hypothetical protein